MRGGFDDRGRMKPQDGAKENAQKYQAESTDSEQRNSEDSGWRKMVLREPDVKFVLRQIRDVAFQCCNVLAQRITKKDPPRMRPPLAIARRVRVTFLVRELVMLTMDGHPQQRAAFQSRHAADGEEVLKPLGCRVGALGEQPVITDAEADAPGDPVQKDRYEQPPPGEEEECGHSAAVTQRQHRRNRPVQSILVGLIVLHAIKL